MTLEEGIQEAVKKLGGSPDKEEHTRNFHAVFDVPKFLSEIKTLREIYGVELEGKLTISDIISLRQVSAMKDLESALSGYYELFEDLTKAIRYHE